VSTTPNYLTPQGYAALTNERNQLLKVERPKTVEIVSWAASNGDRSENGDYIYGKRRLREIDRRLRFLFKRLELATVTLVDQEGHEQTLRIVGVDETHLGPNYISWVSPIARALIKSREGDSVTFESPSGIRTVEIIRVTYAG
jgi:transcription elongation factor GreB